MLFRFALIVARPVCALLVFQITTVDPVDTDTIGIRHVCYSLGDGSKQQLILLFVSTW